jgi:probable HAF family extracellular repeat protein
VDGNGVTHGYLVRNGKFTTLDFPHASVTAARGINARGDIVGRVQFADGADHGFLYRDGHFTQIDFPGSMGTIGRGINNAGDITGNYTDSQENEIAFILHDGTFKSVSVDPCSSDIWMIMDNGQVAAGDNCVNPDNSLHGFVIDHEGKSHVLDFPGLRIPCTAARWINERGEIVGLFAHVHTVDECYDGASYHGFLLRHGEYRAINVPGATDTQVFAINDDGQIVGQYTDRNGNTYGFMGVRKDR